MKKQTRVSSTAVASTQHNLMQQLSTRIIKNIFKFLFSQLCAPTIMWWHDAENEINYKTNDGLVKLLRSHGPLTRLLLAKSRIHCVWENCILILMLFFLLTTTITAVTTITERHIGMLSCIFVYVCGYKGLLEKN